jgi:hypothetical protein
MCQDGVRPLSFETLLDDPLIRMMMAADRLSPRDVVLPLAAARDALAARERRAVSAALSAPSAMNVPA